MANANHQLIDIDLQAQRLRDLEVHFHAGQLFPNVGTRWGCPNCPQFPGVLGGQQACLNNGCPHHLALQVYCGQSSYSLRGLYAQQEGVATAEAMSRLQKKLGVENENPYSSVPEQDRGGWHQLKDIRQFAFTTPCATLIPFFGPRGNTLGAVEVRQLGNQKVIVPMTAWSYGASSREVLLHVPFDAPCPLLNWNLIANNPSAEIWLTDSLELAYFRTMLPDRPGVWTSWFGRGSTALDVNWGILSGHKVNYLLHQHSGLSQKAQLETAIAAISKLKQVQDVTIDVDDSRFAPSPIQLNSLIRNQWAK